MGDHRCRYVLSYVRHTGAGDLLKLVITYHHCKVRQMCVWGPLGRLLGRTTYHYQNNSSGVWAMAQWLGELTVLTEDSVSSTHVAAHSQL